LIPAEDFLFATNGTEKCSEITCGQNQGNSTCASIRTGHMGRVTIFYATNCQAQHPAGKKKKSPEKECSPAIDQN
jgi:hypothetical protein